MPSPSPNLRGVADLGARAADIECAALGEEVHASSINRRLDPKRHAHGFACRAGDPERPHGQLQRRRGDARFSRNQCHQLVEGRDLSARQDVRPVCGSRHFAAQPEAFDEVIDVRQMIKDVPRAQHHKSPPRNAPEQLQQPAIAWAVDARRTRDRDRHPRTRRRIASDALAFDFRHLINIAGPQRRVFVGGRMLDVAMHANRAAVDNPPNAGRGGGIDQIAHGRGVDRAVRGRRNAGLPVYGGDVIDHFDVAYGARKRRTILERADHRFDARGFQIASLLGSGARVPGRHILGARAYAPDGRP